jgi:hypothetical protein
VRQQELDPDRLRNGTSPEARSLRRVYSYCVAGGISGAALFAFVQGWRAGLGFALGAALSSINFRWLHHSVDVLDPHRPPPPRRSMYFLILRYAVLGGGAYAIVRSFEVQALTVILGLSVPVAAIFLEAIYELIHGRA